MPTTARLAAVLCAAASVAAARATLAQEPTFPDPPRSETRSPTTPRDPGQGPTSDLSASAPSPRCAEGEPASASAPSSGRRAMSPAVGALGGVVVLLRVCSAAPPVTPILCLALVVYAPWAAVGVVAAAMAIGAASAAKQDPAAASREGCGAAPQDAPPRGGPAADPPWPQAPTPDVPLAGASFDGPVPDAQWAS